MDGFRSFISGESRGKARLIDLLHLTLGSMFDPASLGMTANELPDAGYPGLGEATSLVARAVGATSRKERSSHFRAAAQEINALARVIADKSGSMFGRAPGILFTGLGSGHPRVSVLPRKAGSTYWIDLAGVYSVKAGKIV